MKTVTKLNLYHLSFVPLLTERGESVEIIPYEDFSKNPEGEKRYNIINREGYWNLLGNDCDWLSENVFRVYDEHERELIVTVDVNAKW